MEMVLGNGHNTRLEPLVIVRRMTAFAHNASLYSSCANQAHDSNNALSIELFGRFIVHSLYIRCGCDTLRQRRCQSLTQNYVRE